MAQAGGAVDRARELYDEGRQAFRACDQERSRAVNEESLALCRRTGDKAGEIRALVGLSRVALREVDLERVERLMDEAMAIATATGDRENEILPRHMRAEAARLAGDLDRAERLYDESLALHRELGNEGWVAIEQHNKAYVSLRRGDLAQAATLFSESLCANRRLGRETGQVACLVGLAAVAAAAGTVAGVTRAARLFGAAETHMRRLGMIMDPADQPEYDRGLAAARAGLEPSSFSAASQAGQAMSLQEAVADALASDQVG